MTINHSQHGRTVSVSDVELVEHAFRDAGADPTKLGAGFITYWLGQGKNIAEILDIAGFTREYLQTRQNGAAA